MTWLQFLVFQGVLTLFLLVITRRSLTRNWGRLAKVIAFGVAVGFPLDYIAEDRVFWRFGERPMVTFLGIPVANLCFTAIFVTDIILIHLATLRFVPSHIGQAQGPVPQRGAPNNQRDRSLDQPPPG